MIYKYAGHLPSDKNIKYNQLSTFSIHSVISLNLSFQTNPKIPPFQPHKLKRLAPPRYKPLFYMLQIRIKNTKLN